ncbi:MAG: hypothetical protein AB1649_11255 [Chloroflexota bacterium]
MSSQNWIKIAVALIIGIGLGLAYGLFIDPVQYADATPNILREDYRADYVLMVAEAYQGEQNPELAARRLAILGSESPAEFVSSTIEYARVNGFSQDEITLLQGLLTAMQTYQPAGDSAP